jgi:hypothetical protein
MSSPDHEAPAVSRALAHAFRGDVASEPELRRAYLRFLQKRPSRIRPSALTVIGWVGAGMLLGMGSLYAATRGPWKLPGFGVSFTSQRARALDEPTPASRRATVAQASEVNSAEPAASAMAELRPPELVGRPTRPLSSALTPDGSESWERAARGLRERDFGTADDALLKLAEQGSPSERETAQLVRAQLLLSQGRRAEAQASLSQLEHSATTPSVRRKAQQLANELRQSVPSQRSFEPLPSTKGP